MNNALTTQRKNWIAIDNALEPLGGPSVRAILEQNMSAADFLELLAEKGVELRFIAQEAKS